MLTYNTNSKTGPICGGSGPQFTCESSGKSYCTEYQYEQGCKSD